MKMTDQSRSVKCLANLTLKGFLLPMGNLTAGKLLILVVVVASIIGLVVFNTSLNRDGTGPVLVHAPRAGMFRSVVWKSFRKERPFHSFISIPYALPPVGKLRFQPPVPLGPLKEEHESANQVEVKCMQVQFPLEEPSRQEDCLYLNVYSPSPIPDLGPSNSSNGLPVILFIHGGTFTAGSGGSRLYSPQKLMDEDIILVTVNYRLGILGFLTFENEYAPGNLALRDQQLAMEWVKANIWFFGGDPGRVTLMGQSAGSMAVSYHMVSPRAKNLFHRAIMMSGTFTNSALNINLSPRMYMASVAVALGCLKSSLEIEGMDAKGSMQLLECLVGVPSIELIKFNSYFTISFSLTGPLVFIPVVDGHFTKDPVLPSDPASMLKAGQFHKVPVMTGTMEQEGVVFSYAFMRHPHLWDTLMQQWQSLAPLVILGRSPEAVTSGDELWVSMITSDYFGQHEDDSQFELQRLNNLFEDRICNYPLRKFVELLCQDPEAPSVYTYLISHQPTVSVSDYLLPKWKLALKVLIIRLLGINVGSINMGASHFDDMLLIFSLNIPILKDNILHTPDDFRISRTLISYLVNFASSGNPNIGLETLNSATWLPVSWPDSLDYLNISSKKIFEMTYDKDRRRREELWRQVDLNVTSYNHAYLKNKVLPLSRLDFLNTDVDYKAERNYFGGAYLKNLTDGFSFSSSLVAVTSNLYHLLMT